jgi:hypothetical protein
MNGAAFITTGSIVKKNLRRRENGLTYIPLKQATHDVGLGTNLYAIDKVGVWNLLLAPQTSLDKLSKFVKLMVCL